MKADIMCKKILRAILVILIVILYFASSAIAKNDKVNSETKQATKAEPPSKATGSDKTVSDINNVTTSDTTTLSGGWEPPPPPTPSPVSPSAIGGAFSSLMGETFKTDLATGAATMNIPIVIPPGRKNMQPNISLSYSSNNSNGICGTGWAVPVMTIQRSAKNGVPRYTNMADFTAGGQELVNIGADEYKLKLESSFTKYIYSSADSKWIAYDKSGIKYYFGSTDASRTSCPTNPAYIFIWHIDKVSDVYGNTIAYEYEKEDGVVYLKYIYYTSNDQCTPVLNADKRIEFIYGAAERPDKIYSRRAGWPAVLKRRLEKIKVYIDANKDSVWGAGEVIWTYNLSYILSADTSCLLLASIQLEDNGGNVLPARTFTYQSLEP